MMTMISVRVLFASVERMKWSDFIYLSPGDVTLDTMCLVLDPDEVDAGEELPKVAQELGLVEAIGIRDLSSILENAQKQGRKPSECELLEAFRYYLLNDAYITFDA